MDGVRYPVVELRQYRLRSGQREVLIELFDREFVESQEAEGMAVVGQFRDLDDPDRFVWIRGFASMAARARALAGFYGGPVWKANSAAANATMLDTDDVLLLRPVSALAGLPIPSAPRSGAAGTSAAQSRILVTLYFGDRPFDSAFTGFFGRHVRPVLAESGAPPIARLQTLYAENTFPALPVRTGEHVFAWLARFASQEDLDRHVGRLQRSERWRDSVQPALSALLTTAPQHLRLAPTARSLLR